MNYLLIESLKTFGDFFDEDFQVEFPAGSGQKLSLKNACLELKKRLLSIFLRNEKNERPVFGPYNSIYAKEENKGLILFHEYFHGDNSFGLGASHQTGWTALVANLSIDLEGDEKI